MATSSKSLSNMAANQAPLHKMAATPEPPAVIDVKSQSSAIMDATPVFLSIVNVAFEDTKVFQRWLRLLSSVADPPLDPPAVRAAGIPRTSALVVTKTVLLSSIFPVKWWLPFCVFRPHTDCALLQSLLQSSNSLQSLHEADPEFTPGHEFSPAPHLPLQLLRWWLLLQNLPRWWRLL